MFEAGPSTLMERASRLRASANVLGAVAVGAVVLLGVLVRLEETLADPVVPAEDPYNHMMRVKTHLHVGAVEPAGPFGELYPPGMHATLAAVWAFVGGDLYTLFRFAPSLLGGLAILGTALVLWRNAGRAAAFVGALGVALAPEIIFRTTMMAPTAIDVALLPFFFYALLEVLAGRLTWVGPAALLSAYLVLAHPWIFAILALTGLAFLVLAFAYPWPTSRSARLSTRGFAAALAIVGVSLALVLSTCAGFCGPGFQKVLSVPGWLGTLVAPAVFVASLLPAAFLLVQPQALSFLPQHPFEPRSLVYRLGASAVLGLGLAGLVLWTLGTPMPEYVDFPSMLGWPLLGLASAAVVVLPFLASPLAYLATGLSLTTFFASVLSPLGAESLAHRNVVYLGLGVAMLAGLAAAAAARLLQQGGRRLLDRRSASGPALAAAAAVPALLAAGSLGGLVVAESPEPYPDGWYRLYGPCEMDALREISERVGAEPSTLVVAGDWRPGLVLSALVDPAARTWFSESFFASESERRGLVMELETKPGSLYVVEERHLRTQNPDRDTGFLHSSDWRVVTSWCHDSAGVDRTVRLYVHEATR